MPTKMPEAPVLVEGGWQETTKDEVRKDTSFWALLRSVVLNSRCLLGSVFENDSLKKIFTAWMQPAL